MNTPRILIAAVTVFVLAACGTPYDEAKHRAEIEAALGHPVADWPKLLGSVHRTCDMGETAFGYYVAMSMDGGTLETTRINVRHVCPDRLAEVEETVAEAGKDWCDNPTTEEEKLMAEAMRCPSPP